MLTSSEFHNLLSAIHAFYSLDVKTYPLTQTLTTEIEALLGQPITKTEPAPLPVLRHLEAIATAEMHPSVTPMVTALAAIAHKLPWMQNPNYAKFGKHYLDNYGFTMLVGPVGVIPHDKIIVSLGIWSDVVYPMHHHEPEEIYHVLTGTPDFRVADSEFTPKQSGDAIFHAAWQPHAQRFAGPSLLMASWVGDVEAYAVLVEE